MGRQVLLAASANWWSGSEIDRISTLVALTGQARVYASRGVYGLAGVGVVGAAGSDQLAFGLSGIVGAGYDVAVSEAMSVTPYVHWVLVHEGTNLLQAGLALTIHR